MTSSSARDTGSLVCIVLWYWMNCSTLNFVTCLYHSDQKSNLTFKIVESQPCILNPSNQSSSLHLCILGFLSFLFIHWSIFPASKKCHILFGISATTSNDIIAGNGRILTKFLQWHLLSSDTVWSATNNPGIGGR